VKDIVFTRLPDRQLTQRSFIEPFAATTKFRVLRCL